MGQNTPAIPNQQYQESKWEIMLKTNRQQIGKSLKIIKIQNLPRKEQFIPQKVTLKYLVDQLDRTKMVEVGKANKQSNLTFQQKLYCYNDTGIGQQRVLGDFHNFFNAFFFPYNKHGDLFLIPDDIWLMICLFLSKYIDKHSEKLRKLFVRHQGQKQLTVIQQAGSLEQSLKMQKQWEFFFHSIIKQIQKNTLPGVIESLSCNFSTTTQVYRLISTSIIMASMKNYFSYTRVICDCGINNVYLGGTREDWAKLLEKTLYINRYDVDGELKTYISKMEVILKNFIDTYDEKPDINWWNKIMTTQERRLGSGGQIDCSIQGWILHFYGIYQKIESTDWLPKTMVSLPIKLVNKISKTEKKLELLTDWVSVSKIDMFTYKPDIGMCIVERSIKNI